VSFGTMQSLHVYLFKSYGNGDVRKKTAYLVPVGDEDCSCPDEAPSIPVAYDWLYDMQFKNGAWGWTKIGATAYEDGVGYTTRDMVQYDGMPNIKRLVQYTGDVPVLRYAKIYWGSWPACEYWASESWLQMSPGSDWQGLEIAGADDASKLFSLSLTPYGNEFLIGAVQATDGATSGDGILSRLVLAGTGSEPFPGAAEGDADL